MYQIGDLIMYRKEGVCRVEAIGVLEPSSSNNERLYYTLSPSNRDGIIYIPVDNEVFMRPVITYGEVQELIKQIPHIRSTVLHEPRNLKMLSDYYETLMKTHDCADLIQLIETIDTKRQFSAENGKKLGKIDEHYLKLAEDLLYGEFAIALGIPKGDVKDYIEENIKAVI